MVAHGVMTSPATGVRPACRIERRTPLPLKVLLVLIAAATLCACATSQVAWASRADANLGADKAVCKKTADDLNMDAAATYTNGRYGIAAAMASRIDQGQVAGGTLDRARDAVFEDCMVRKGWQKQ